MPPLRVQRPGWIVISESGETCADCGHEFVIGEPALVRWPFQPYGPHIEALSCDICWLQYGPLHTHPKAKP